MSDVIPEPPQRSNSHLMSRIRLIEGDLLDQMDVDAIVATILPTLKAEGHLNEAIIAKAGQTLDNFVVDNIFKPRSGDVFSVPPFGIPVKHIFYAVMPIWKDNLANEERDLTRCYRGVMELAVKMNLDKIAVPALGCRQGTFPVKRAARLGVQGILDRMSEKLQDVRIVCRTREQYDAFHFWLKHYGWEG
jgi:O-acetyl-ADP-ribose deacetylase (regulator of RNase III)